MKRNHLIAIIAGATGLVAATAGASALIINHEYDLKPKVEATTQQSATHASAEKIHWNNAPSNTQAAAPQPVNCDDGNVVGTIAGGVGGGVIGSNIGAGKGKTAATIGATLGGAYLGRKYIPTNNVTCGQR